MKIFNEKRDFFLQNSALSCFQLTVCGLFFLVQLPAFCQQKEFTFHPDIAPIIHLNCTPCHSPGNPGPFSMISYEDVAKRAEFIVQVTQSRYMPPFHADFTFQHYTNERKLTGEEIAKIKMWVEQGAIAGKEKKKKTEKVEKADFLKLNRPPDLVLSMNQPFIIPGNLKEEFRFFSLPTPLQENRYIQAIEFVPGSTKQVHHSRIMVDTTQQIRGIDGLSETDPKVYEFQKIPLSDEFLYGWVPGNMPIKFPKGSGKKLPAHSDLILNIHYSPTVSAVSDRSAVKIWLTDKPIEREIKTITLTERNIKNQPFFLRANTKPTFFMESLPLPEAVSLFSIMPHMHLLGKTFKAIAILPDSSVVNLVKIDDWDFRWQMTYIFKNLIHLPKGSIIKAEAMYDNTITNPMNVFRPTRNIRYGWGVTDEMMNLVIYYLSYKQGDEITELGK